MSPGLLTQNLKKEKEKPLLLCQNYHDTLKLSSLTALYFDKVN